MTLDLSRLSGEIRAMSDHLAANRWAVFDRTARARELLATADGPALVAAAEAGRGSVIPVESPATRQALGEVPTDYQVLATDGSQIEPDRHGPALCFLINVGWAVIEYGDHAAAELASAPELCYRPEDLYVRVGNRQAAIQGSRLEARRTVAEIKRLARLATVPLALPRVALSDGLLLFGAYWEGPEGFVRDYFLAQFREALAMLQALEVPVAGYVSRPRSSDVVSLLRLDPRHRDGCPRCGAGAGDADCGLDALADRLLFEDLAPGERSALFESRTLAQHYPAELLPRFFYVNVGREVARVEMPAWAAVQPPLVERVQAVVVDQCRRGQGYPVALARAHEQAVVSGGDRLRFNELVTRALVSRGLPDHPSEKQASKLARAV